MFRLIYISAFLLFAILPTANSESLLDRVNKKINKSRQKWDSSKKPCDECGKIIRVGGKCINCRWKYSKTRKKSREVLNSAKDKWKNMERNCSICGKKIHGRSICAKCLAKKAKPHIENVAKKTAKWTSEGAKVITKSAKETAENYKQAVKRTADQTSKPNNFLELYNTISIFKRESRIAKRESIEDSVRVILSHSLDKKNGSSSRTLEMAIQKRVSEVAPNMTDSDLYSDPAIPITALILHDRKYFLNNFRFIETKKGIQSLTEHVKYVTKIDKLRENKCISLIGDISRLSKSADEGEIDIGKFRDVFTRLKEIQNANN